MLTEEKRESIIEAIKGLEIDRRIACVALYSHTIKLYDRADIFEKDSNKIGIQVAASATKFAKQIADTARGVTPVKVEDLGDLSEFFDQDEIAKIPQIESKKIPDYWGQVLSNVEMIAGIIEETDKPALQALNRIEVTIPEGENCEYSVIFHFDENEYFSNESLEVHVTADKNDEIIEMDSDIIDWKEGKNLAYKEATGEAGASKNKKKKKKGGKAKEKQAKRSFFHIFKAVTQEELEEGIKEDADEVEQEYDPMFMGDILSFIKNLVLKYHAPSFFDIEIPDYTMAGNPYDELDMEQLQSLAGKAGKKPSKEECQKQ